MTSPPRVRIERVTGYPSDLSHNSTPSPLVVLRTCQARDDVAVEWSWVAGLDEVQERRQHARRLAGLQLAAVRYCEIDYTMPDRQEGQQGPRSVVDETEWRKPSFRYDFGDSTDYGVELETACGRVFTVSWDSPGRHEGLWLRELPLVGEAVLAEANTAIWDVSRAGRWDRFIGHKISDVWLHYRPWAPNDGYWCTRVTISIRGSDIQLLGGQAEAGQTLAPSADNVAVIFPPRRLPEWELYDDGV
jgi:hypothetical protein